MHVPIHGVYENGIDQMDHRDSLRPYFDELKAAGYHTALIGKTHFSPTPVSIDHLDAHTGNSDMRSASTSAADFLETYLVDETIRWVGGLPTGGGGAGAGEGADGEDGAAPWYCYTSMVSPHGPNWVPEGPWTAAYEGVELPPLNFREGNIAALPYQTRMLLGLLGHEHSHPPAFPAGRPDMGYIDQPIAPADGTDRGNGRRNYYTQAAYVDFQVGRLLDFLDDAELAANTLVIFSSDHGSELFDHGINNDKHNFLDASFRVPLILRLPGVLAAGGVQRFATTLDIPATILAAAGAPIPNEYQGFDLLTPLRAGRPSPRTVGIGCEYRAMAVVTPSWKLAYFPEQDEGRLWDRVADPAEQTDLWAADRPAVAVARAGLLKALLRWRAQQDALGFMQANLQGYGPTAQVVIDHTNTIRGLDAEVRLQQDALRFEHGTYDYELPPGTSCPCGSGGGGTSGTSGGGTSGGGGGSGGHRRMLVASNSSNIGNATTAPESESSSSAAAAAGHASAGANRRAEFEAMPKEELVRLLLEADRVGEGGSGGPAKK
eukprot:SAG22_NODE_459_length_10228_cov_9.593642_3_plen_547_part_00